MNVVKIVFEGRFSHVLVVQHLQCFLLSCCPGEQLQPGGAILIHTEGKERGLIFLEQWDLACCFLRNGPGES